MLLPVPPSMTNPAVSPIMAQAPLIASIWRCFYGDSVKSLLGTINIKHLNYVMNNKEENLRSQYYQLTLSLSVALN